MDLFQFISPLASFPVQFSHGISILLLDSLLFYSSYGLFYISPILSVFCRSILRCSGENILTSILWPVFFDSTHFQGRTRKELHIGESN